MHSHSGSVLEILAGADLLALALVGVHWLLLQAIYLTRNHGRPRATVSQPGHEWPLLSVLVPAYNEERVIEATVRSLLAADYRALEIIVIDDCSQDHTAQIVAGLAADDARIRLLELPQNQGKALALNAGIVAATSEYLVVIDADTIANVDFLKLMAAPLVSGHADAVAGNVKAGHPERSGVIRALQSIEYVSVLHMTRLIQECSNAVTTIPGAAGAFRKAALHAAGAYLPQAKAEDTDLSFRLVKNGFRIVYQPRAIVWTEVPSTWRSLFQQRLRWIHGNLQCIFRNQSSQFSTVHRGRYASAAFVYENLWRPPLEFARAGIPVLVLIGALPAGSILGYVGLLALNWLVFAISYRVEQESARELLYVPIQQAIWPIFLIIPYCLAVWHYVFRNQTPWGRAARNGTLASLVMRSELTGRRPDESGTDRNS